MKRKSVISGTPWEASVGYCRAVRVGNVVEVSGTTAMDGDRAVGVNDPVQQTHFVLNRISAALNELDAALTDVVRTRMYVTNIDDWEQIGKVHGEYFKSIRPAATMVEVSRLIRPELVVEIEVTAIVGDTR